MKTGKQLTKKEANEQIQRLLDLFPNGCGLSEILLDLQATINSMEYVSCTSDLTSLLNG